MRAKLSDRYTEQIPGTLHACRASDATGWYALWIAGNAAVIGATEPRDAPIAN